MNLDDVKRYISAAGKEESEPDEPSLDILEHFAWKKSVSAYQIYSDLKSTDLKKAYKNVNKRVNALLSAGLIKETGIDNNENNKHNAKYYRLTEYGIYQIFLHRKESLQRDQSDHRASIIHTPSNALTFFRNYSDSMLFKVFLYPYFRKESLFAVGNGILPELYRYLASCCGAIQEFLETVGRDIPFFDPMFSWNNIPGKDNRILLIHLKQIFSLGSIDEPDIKKEESDEHSKIIVKTSNAAPIVITLHKVTNKVVIASSTDDGQYKAVEYNAYMLDQELIVGEVVSHYQSIINGMKHEMEQLIYGFVYRLASSSALDQVSYYVQVLSGDNKFVSVLQGIYENRHKGFERGYRMLIKQN